MAKYDPDEDAPYGLARADLPVTFYDRPQIGLSNLLRGDIDGLTRAMLSPDTLTPAQLQTITTKLLGRKPNSVMKTIVDIGTNPLVIIGLIAGLMYPMGTTKVLLNLRKGLLPKSAAMSNAMSGFHGALMKLRTVPKLFDNFADLVRETGEFTIKHGEKANQIFVNAGAMSKVQGLAIAARLDGLHTAKHFMVKALQNEPEFMVFFGKKGVPIAANLQGKMSTGMMKTHGQLRSWYNSMFKTISKDTKAWSKMKKAVENKGYEIGGQVDDYFPRSGDWNKYYKASRRGSSGVDYRKHLYKEVEEKVGKKLVARKGGLFANVDDLVELEKAGYIPAGFNAKVTQPIINRWSAEATATTGKIWDDVVKLGLPSAEEQVEFVSRMTKHYSTGAGKATNFVARLGTPEKANETLYAMARSLQSSKIQSAEVLQRELSEIGKTLAVPGQYSLDPWKATERYINAIGSDYIYHGKGYGDRIMKIVKTPGIFEHEPHLKSYIMDSLLPHVRGVMTWKAMGQSIGSARNKDKILGWVKNHPMVEKTLGSKNYRTIIDNYSKSHVLSGKTMGENMANWFHLSTLGLNMSATTANSMQTFITTINNVGPQGLWRGLKGFGGEKGLIERASGYMGMIAKGVEKKTAFKKAFPEFVDEMGAWSKTTERLLSGDIAASGMPKLFKAKGVWEKIKGSMMLPFSTTEAGNQLLAFYSGRHQHLYNNAAKLATVGRGAIMRDAGKVGGSLALTTQFAGGPLGIPSHIMNMNPVWRQYMHFPMRFLSYLHGTLRMGADPNKLDFGTIGRILAGSTAASIVSRNLMGLDIQRGLMIGALPIAGFQKAPFFPWPLVPPAASIVGEMVKAVSTGETGGLGATASMLVPGGVAFRRAYKSLAPRYANYENPTPDGRIPLYNHDRALIGTLDPLELALKAIGLRPQNVSAEAGAAKWLVSQRDRIRGYRRDYTMALFQNETAKAERINKDFQKVYPELGPLKIKKSDIRALENRREISRLQRIEKGIPTAYRPIFSQIIGEASLAQMTEGIEMGSLGGLENYLPQQ